MCLDSQSAKLDFAMDSRLRGNDGYGRGNEFVPWSHPAADGASFTTVVSSRYSACGGYLAVSYSAWREYVLQRFCFTGR